MGITKFLLIPTTASIVIPVSLISLNSSLNDELVLATYQSYIDEGIAEEAYRDFSLKTIYFENDKEVFNGFSSGAFDLAILSSSTLEEAVKKNLVKKINWEKFESVKEKLKSSIQANGAENQKHNWKDLYSPVVEKFFTLSPQLSEYGVPYFLSYLVFAYSGEKLNTNGSSVQESRGDNPESQQSQMSWKELVEKIIADKRFKTKKGLPALGMVEDELTLYSLSKLTNGSAAAGGASPKTEDLFAKEQKQLESEFYKQFLKINDSGINKEKLGARPLFLSPDSGVLSEMLCNGSLTGAFVYNGDALYAQQMIDDGDCGDEEGEDDSDSETDTGADDTSDQVTTSENTPSKKREIKIITGSPTLWFLDSIAISAQVSKEKEEKIYKFLNKLSFEGLEKFKNSQLDRQKILNDTNRDDESEDSKSWLLRNFKEIQYTPALKDFSSWIKGENTNGQQPTSPAPESKEDFYKRKKEFLYGDPDIEKCIGEQSKNNGKAGSHPQNNQKCSVVFERGLTDLQNLNLTLAFERWKSNF